MNESGRVEEKGKDVCDNNNRTPHDNLNGVTQSDSTRSLEHSQTPRLPK